MEAPFVSEEFQRAFRNTFSAQVSTGRDLHVSDVVIPVVDFTPTASGTSLPSQLQFAKNDNSSNTTSTSSASAVDLYDGAGFVRLETYFTVTGASSGVSFAQVDLYDKNTSTNKGSMQFYRLQTGSGQSVIYSRDDIVYIPSNHKLIYYRDPNSQTSAINMCVTLLADLNGNLVNPAGYNPQ